MVMAASKKRLLRKVSFGSTQSPAKQAKKLNTKSPEAEADYLQLSQQ
jgi:hypothetical protein